MKHNTFKLVFITCLLSIGSVAYAKEEAAKSDAETAKTVPDASADKAGDENAPAEKEEAKVHVKKLNNSMSHRAIGGLFANKPKPASTRANSSAEAKQRIEQLEDLVQQQQKLIEMYKNQNK